MENVFKRINSQPQEKIMNLFIRKGQTTLNYEIMQSN